MNRFCYELHSLIAWKRVFAIVDEDEKFIALFEFVTPLATSCLSLPYSIRQMLIKSVCSISHQTNRFCVSGWDEALLKRDRDLKLEDADQFASQFTCWTAMRAALERLNDKGFTAATDDHRNRTNHGFARRIEMGHILTIKRDPKSFVYRIVDALPLGIGDLIPALAEQYEIAVDCYHAYVDLVREQRRLWLSHTGAEVE